MLREFRKRSVMAVLASGLLGVALVGVGCGPANDVGSAGDHAEDEGVSSAKAS
jgi:hypothetical protein